MWTAGAIVLCMVLYLIDKHDKWTSFGRVLKWVAIIVGGLFVLPAIDKYTGNWWTSLIVALVFWGTVGVIAALWKWGGERQKKLEKHDQT
jgi:hypothetical protein